MRYLGRATVWQITKAPRHGSVIHRIVVAAFLCQLMACRVSGQEQAARFADRVLYAPGHFGNSYEVMGRNEMRAMLAEAKHWGYNRYADWFDMVDCSDPFAKHSHTHMQLAEALWQRKKENFLSAQEAGFACDLTITPNHVYIDQCLPDLLAKKGKRVFGQLICPSVPQARAIILKDYENIFADLAKAGVQLSAICPGPYDYGGCLCDKCQPWILTFAQLCADIHDICRRYHPGVQMHMIGWWWQPEEHAMFARWVNENRPGWVKRIYLHIPYGKTSVADVELPADCRRAAFVHIGYGEKTSPRDVYGQLGPVVAARRMERTVNGLAQQHVSAVMAYSEGVFDDVNKALLGGLGSGRFATADSLLAAYARRYFGATADHAGAWAKWLAAWGDPYSVDPDAASKELESLRASAAPNDWRLRQWELKLEMFDLNKRIGTGTKWTPARLELADQFWAVREQIHRQVWGLGPERHILNKRFSAVPWYSSWQQQTTLK